MKQADRIRRYVVEAIIAPARERGLAMVTVRAGDVHRALKLERAYPAVCSVLGGGKLVSEAQVSLVERDGLANGSNVYFRYQLGGPDRSLRAERIATKKVHVRTVPPSQGKVDWSSSLVLVSCTKAKTTRRAPAQDLYSSPAFLMKKRLIQRCNAEWMILSAKHGLVEPTTAIQPYDQTLTTMGMAARRQWANGLLPDLLARARRYGSVVLLAGDKYAEHLIGPLTDAGIDVNRPMAGLRQGEQLQWLAARQ